jgi:hypothetical protein
MRVPFNHAYSTLSRPSYDVLASSETLRALARVEVRTTTDGQGQSWAGIYIIGESTYLELLRPDSMGGMREQSMGLALSPEETDGLAYCESRWDADAIASRSQTVMRRTDGSDVPWFTMATPALFGEHSLFHFWCMQYHRDFLNKWEASIGPTSGIDRASVLAKYTHVLGLKHQAVLRDVIGIALQLSDADAVSLRRCLVALAWRAVDSSTFYGPDDFVLSATAVATGPPKLVSVTFRTDASPCSEITLGPAGLSLRGRTATLVFS